MASGDRSTWGDSEVASLRLQASALEHLQDPVFILDATGAIVYANGPARSVAPNPGKSPTGKAPGEPWAFWSDNLTWEQFLERVRTAGHWEGEIQFPDAPGGCQRWTCRAHTWVETDSPTPYIGVHLRDRSESRREEQQRQLLEERLRQAQKMESLGTLAGGVAHDFNNLLMVVLGNADLAMMDLEESSPLRGYLQAIESGARRASELSMQMLAYSGKASFRKNIVHINTIVSDMASLLGSTISHQGEIQLDLAPAISLIHADPGQIRQILINLVVNASEALQDGKGLIRIRTGQQHCDAEYLRSPYLFDELPEGEYIYLEVEDSGIGMTGSVLRRIFDPFFTTRFTGRGLGLAAVLGIVKGHAGTIKVTSQPGVGSIFRVLFPLVSESKIRAVFQAQSDPL